MQVLGVGVPSALCDKWAGWLAPSVQPFYVLHPISGLRSLPDKDITPELRDTYRTYALSPHLEIVFLDQASFCSLPQLSRAHLVRQQVDVGRGATPSVRAWADLLDARQLRSQADGHRFVWWPSLIRRDRSAILSRVVSSDGMHSLHARVPSRVWRRSARAAPHARRLAGRFPDGSGPNCFGAVMGACGERGAEREWTHQPEFESWLMCHAEPTRIGGISGTILVWRDPEGIARHAALDLGGGWAFEKPSQEWWTPFTILPTKEVVRINRRRGIRVERWRPSSE